MGTSNSRADFCIEIDFKKESEAPSRVFRTLSDLIDAFQKLDLDLVQSIDSKIETITLLEDIETGSVKTWLRHVLSGIEDDALKTLDWKPQVGIYLVKAKYCIINFLGGKTEITDKIQIDDLENQLLTLAHETDINFIPAYNPLPKQKLIQHIENITLATKPLIEGDTIKYITYDKEATFNLKFKISPDKIEDLLTRESIESLIKMILKVKKPDYLGDSQWEFRHENKTVKAKVLDEVWLKAFQNREKDVRPGDSIRADVNLIVKYGYDFNVVATQYNIIKVVEILQFNPQNQDTLFSEPD